MSQKFNFLIAQYFFAFLAMALTLPVFAAGTSIQVTGGSGYSNVVNLGSTVDAPTFFGGVVGPHTDGECGSTSSATSTCSNCIAGGTKACNTQRVHSNLVLKFDFKVIGDLTKGRVYLGYKNQSASTDGVFDSNEYTVTTGTNEVEKNGTGTISLKWSAICDVAGLGTTCAETADEKIELDIYIILGSNDITSTNSDHFFVDIFGGDATSATTTPADINLIDCSGGSVGICTFEAFPGDEKVYIDDLGLPNGTSCDNYMAARVFYSTADFADASYGNNGVDANYVDLPLDSGCNPSGDWVINGLTNNIPHFFRISMVDFANNNKFIIDSPSTTYGVGVCPATTQTVGTPSTYVTAAQDNTCDYIATPGVVNGLLPEDLNCFIATAAYGSKLEPKLKVLREFRNRFFQTTAWGKKFIKFYYNYGAKAARKISNKENVKAVVRAALWPIYGFAWMSLHYGLVTSLLAIIATLSLVIYSFRNRQRGVF